MSPISLNPIELIVDILDEIRDDKEIAITQDMNIYLDLGLDSLQAVALAVEIERRAGVRVPETVIPTLHTPLSWATHLSETLNAA